MLGICKLADLQIAGRPWQPLATFLPGMFGSARRCVADADLQILEIVIYILIAG